MGWARTFSIKVPVMTLRLIANTIKGKKEVVHSAARPRFFISLYHKSRPGGRPLKAERGRGQTERNTLPFAPIE